MFALSGAAVSAQPADPVAWLKAEGNALDATSFGNNGVVNGSVPYVTGKVGNAFNFTGNVANYIRIPNSASLQSSLLTVEYWVNFNSALNAVTVAKRNGSSDAWQAGIVFSGGNFLLQFVGNTSGGLFDWYSAPLSSPVVVWTHVAVTYDGSTVKGYINGTQVLTQSVTLQLSSRTADIYVGNYAGTALPLDAKLDELSIYNRARSAAEVLAIFQAGSTGKTSPPTVTSLSPNSGSTAGGTVVTITGTNFSGATAVTFGGNAATDVTVLNATTITATTPARTAGTASVIVTTPSGSNTANSLYTYLAPGDLDPLNPALIGNYVLATAVQPDGKLILAGKFTSVLGVARNNLTRLNADGTLDTTFNPNPNGDVNAVTVQPDGKILLGGLFTNVVATTRNSIARLNADGSLDTGFNPNANGSPMSIVLQADGKVLLGGDFTTLQPNGAASATTRNRLARLNADGSLDTAFNPNASDRVVSMAVQADGKILISGYFLALQPNGAASATTRNRIARLNADGTLDTGFNPNANNWVNSLALEPDGQILLGGDFTSLQPNGAASATTRNRIARLNADGTLDMGFDPNANGSVLGIAVQADGKVLLGGYFVALQPNGAASSTARNCIARVNADGTLDAAFDPKPNNALFGLALQADGKVLMGGLFSTLQPNGAASATPRSLFARVANDAAVSTVSVPSFSQVQWTRSGSAPEVSRVTFDLSTDSGASWSALGNGTRVGSTSNWQLTGLSLPASGVVRARGATTHGYFNGSSGLVESTATFLLPSAPTVTGISPATGSTLGGTSVTITGTNLTGATSVTFGGSAATNVSVVTATTITATTPAGTAGTASVVVTTAGSSNAANSLYTYATPTPSDPVAWLRAEGNALDATSNGNHGVVTGSVAYTAGRVGSAFSFNGTSSNFVRIPNSASLQSSLLTVEYWIYFNSVQNSLNVTKRSASGAGDAWQVGIAYAGGNFLLQFVGSTSGGLFDWYSPALSSPVGAWTHVAATYDGTTVRGYVNGVLQLTQAVTLNLSTRNADIYVGATANGTSALDGKMDELAIYNRALSATEVQAIYQAGAAGKGGTPAPTVTGLSPSSGSTVGGSSVTITGTNFTNSSVVTIGGTLATNVTVVNSTTITATTPAGAAGTASVVVNTPGGSNAANSLYTYVTPVTAPSISSVSPATGTTLGGTSVTITGTNFTGATGVTFGGTPATNVTVVSATSLTATTPAKSAGAVSVVVTNPSGSNAANSLFTYVTPANAPSISSVSPATGSTLGGTTVTITGTNFSGATSVTFGGTPAASVSSVSATSITAVTPARSAGAASVVVTTPQGSNEANSLFTYVAPPTVTGISPASGTTLGGTSVTITGTNFTGATGVTIGGAAATNVTIVNATTITATTGARSAGTASVVVTTPGGGNAANTLYTYVTPAPVVTGVSPSSGTTAGGTSIAITGSNLTGATSVTVGGVAATGVQVFTDNQITAFTPAGTAGTASVIVTTPGGSNAANSLFTYVTPPTGPVAWLSAEGVADDITGRGNHGVVNGTVAYVPGKVGRAFSFNGVGTNSVRIPNSSSLQSANLTVEYWIYFNTAQNSVNVTKRNGSSDAWQVGIAYAGGNFLLQFLGANLSGMGEWYSAPLSSPVGVWTHVAVTYSNSTIRGYVNGVMVMEQVPVTLIMQTRTSDIYVGASSTGSAPLDGKIDELSFYDRALGSTEIEAIYNAGAAGKSVPAPTFTSITPASGSTFGGTDVTITGSNFTGATGVTIGGTAATNVTVVNGSTITATTPARPAGTASVVVTTPSGNNAANTAFTFVTPPPPTVTGVSPASGANTGGTSVTITGTNLNGATAVTFGGTAATNFTVVNSTTITATTPARANGAVSVVVTTQGGSNAANTLYTFVTPPPAVTGVSPNSGPLAGGTNVTLTGTNFTGATSVTFRGTAATNVTVVNATTITATTPATNLAGSASVIVTTPAGSNGSNSLFTYEVPPLAINPSSGSLISSGTVLTITGQGFDDATPGNNVVTFTPSGTVTVTASTQTSLTVTGITGLSVGALRAVVTVNSRTSGAPVQVANVVVPIPGDLIPRDLSITGTYVYAIAVQPDGKTILVGFFSAVNGVPRRGIARLNADGSLDMGFDPNAGGNAVYAVAIQPDSKIVIGGSFNTLQPNGASSTISRSGLARLNADGTLDPSVNLQVSGGVNAVSVQADGKILFGGDFTSLVVDGASTPRGRVARLSADGSLDAAFSPNVKDGLVYSIVPQADGRILLGGTFTNLQPNGAASPTSRVGIARVNADGSLDAGFDPRVNFNGYVTSLVEQPDGKILFGGWFGSVQPNGAASATSRRYLARVNADGALDPAFAPAVQGDTVVYSLALQTNGKILVGGYFTGIQENGTGPIAARANLARLNADGSLDADFDPKADNQILAVALQSNGTILLGGNFSTLQPNGAAGSTPVNRIALLVNEPAPQTLTVVDRSTVRWTRGGAAPSVARVSFDVSVDAGSTWISLGAGSRVGTTADWQLSGLSLPAAGILRARGTSGTSTWESTTPFSGLDAEAPSLTGVSPANGTTFGGTTVTISGSAFTGASSVTFGGTAAASFTVVNANTISAVTPARAAGAVSVVVTTPGGSNAANSFFTFVTPPAPTVTGVSPASGVNTGGTSVAITGTEFLGATSVTFGGTAATNFTVVNSTTITATAPAHATGAVSVVVTTPSGSNPANTLYSFVPPPPTLASVSPSSGVNRGGTLVTLTGTDFTGATSVKFGTRDAVSFTVVNSTTITAVTPATGEQTVSVVVTTPTGSNAANSLFTFRAPIATNTQLSSSQFTSVFLSPPTFIASVSTLGGAPVPGKIALFIDDVLLERKAVDSAGWAYFTPSPAQLRGGTRTIRAVYNDDLAASDYDSSEAAAISQTVTKSPVSISLNSATLTQTYDGTSRAVTFTTGTLPATHTASGVLVNVTYNGGALVPINAGTYAVVATINDPSLSGTASGTLTINKAAATCTFQNLVFTWDGQPKPAVVTVTPDVPFSVTYDPLVNNTPSGAPTSTPPTNPGNYKVIVTNPNYAITPPTTNPLTITPRGVSISLGDLIAITDGTPKRVTVTTNPAGINVIVRYQLPNDFQRLDPPILPVDSNWLVYVTATVDQTGYAGSATALMQLIPQPPPQVFLNGPTTGIYGPQTYEVSTDSGIAGKSVSGTVTFLNNDEPIGAVQLDNSGRAKFTTILEPNTVLTRYRIKARFEANAQFKTSTSNTIETVISKRQIDLVPTSPLTVTYDGTNKSVAFKGPGTPPLSVGYRVTYNGSNFLPNAPTTSPISVTATINDNEPRYFGSTTVPFTINKAPATIAVGSLKQSFDGTPKPVSVATTPAGVATTVTYNGSSSPPSAAGSYSVVATLADSNYSAQPATGTLNITVESVRIAITNTLQVFSEGKSSYPVTVTTTPAVTYRVTYNCRSYDYFEPNQGPYGAGTYDVVVTITQLGYTGTASATLVVKPLVTVNHPETIVYGSNTNNPGFDRQGGASAVDGDFVSPSTPFPLVEGAKLRFFDSAENEVRYRFVRWKDGNPNQERLIEANRRVYTPIVRPEIKILAEAHTNINGVEQKSTVGGTVVPLTNGRTYANEREVVTFVANPNPGYIVDRWEHHDFSAAAEPKIYSLQRFSHLYGTEYEEFGAGWVPVKAYFTRGYTVTTGVNVPEAGSAQVVRQDGYGYDAAGYRIGRVDPAFSSASVPVGINTVARAIPQPGYLFNTWIVEGARPASLPTYILPWSPQMQVELTKPTLVFTPTYGNNIKLTAVFVRKVPGPVASFTRLNTLGFGLGVFDVSLTRYPILQIRNAGTGPMTNANIVGVEISGARMKPSSDDVEELTTGGFFEFYLPPNFRPLTPEEIATPDPYFIKFTEYAALMIANKPRLTKPRDAITTSNPISIGTLRPGDYKEFNNLEYFWPKANLSLGLPIGGVSFSLLQYRVTIWISADELPPTPVSFWTN